MWVSKAMLYYSNFAIARIKAGTVRLCVNFWKLTKQLNKIMIIQPNCYIICISIPKLMTETHG